MSSPTELKQENIVNTNNEATQTPPVETEEQINWRTFRQNREVERKEKEAAIKRATEKEAEAAALKAAMEAIIAKPNVSQNYEHQEESEDEKIQKKVDAALAIREKKFIEEQRQREASEMPQKIAQAYPDFNQICTSENLDYLEYHYPEVAKAFQHMPENFDKWSSIYKAVKRFIPNPESRKDSSKAEKNMNKPQAMAKNGLSETGDTLPTKMDDSKRAANWQRMQRIMKGGKR